MDAIVCSTSFTDATPTRNTLFHTLDINTNGVLRKQWKQIKKHTKQNQVQAFLLDATGIPPRHVVLVAAPAFIDATQLEECYRVCLDRASSTPSIHSIVTLLSHPLFLILVRHCVVLGRECVDFQRDTPRQLLYAR